MRYREDLLRGGVELHEFKPTVIADGGEQKKKDNKYIGSSRASLHAKSFSIDKRYMFVGSFNLDPRSIALNTEMGVVFEAPEYATLLSKGFDEFGEVKTYRLALEKKSPDSNAEQLVWYSRENGERVVHTKEPETSWWNRFVAGFMSIFVPESQL
jgi:putative cardiolipin synthase